MEWCSLDVGETVAYVSYSGECIVTERIFIDRCVVTEVFSNVLLVDISSDYFRPGDFHEVVCVQFPDVVVRRP